ncbi:MAG TPA: molybdate ABC transporter substrate-binding protein [Thiotrichales bacterium]|nr:molybdate ABC transporter substrate-binding protein [Thiotrichales bacterium]
MFGHSGQAHGRRGLLALLLLALLEGGTAPAGANEQPLRVAVAANFLPVAERLSTRFTRQTGTPLRLVSGSTGKLYAQIVHGAPFDLFLAADEARPRRLVEEGRARGAPFLYATGTLVLWSPRPGLVDQTGGVLAEGGFSRLAMANPRLAPYGRAARETLQALGLWSRLRSRIVRGENIAQAFHFVVSGNAELGFVAASQLLSRGEEGSRWVVPERLYSPILQAGVVLTAHPAAGRFVHFIRCGEGREIVREGGYRVAADPAC